MQENDIFSDLSFKTNLSGRLKNTTLPKTQGLMPLYEAVVNSIHAIEEAGISMDKGKITIEIIRSSQKTLDIERHPGPDALPEIVAFKISDNGIGFTDENVLSFLTLDSDHKESKGCRGIGRLIWLKAFDTVNISSNYYDKDNKLKTRTFTYSKKNLISDPKTLDANPTAIRETTVRLNDFDEEYRKASKKTKEAIAKELLNHCLWYFIRPSSAPSIDLIDEGEILQLDSFIDDYLSTSAKPETVNIKGRPFEITHVKLKTTALKSHSISYCAGERLVIEESLKGEIPGLFDRVKLEDSDGGFIYDCYISSKYLDDNVLPERTGFNIQDRNEGLLALTDDISFTDIRNAIVPRIEKFLGDLLVKNQEQSKKRVSDFVDKKAPRYKPIIDRLLKNKTCIEPNISDKDLDLLLHKHLADLETDLLEKGYTIMDPRDGETSAQYFKRLNEYMEDTSKLKQSDLANYVFHRKAIINLFKKALKIKPDGTYCTEDIIHNLIMPMRKNSEEVLFEDCNLWLLDEKLAFHHYLASDKPLRVAPVTGSESNQEPDLFSVNIFENPLLVSENEKLPLASITVVEIKRPMRKGISSSPKYEDPIEQAIKYLKKIRAGNVNTKDGRRLNAPDNIPGFCYILCDLNDKIIDKCDLYQLRPNSDETTYFGYIPKINAYIEVITFDGLVNNAEIRNCAFFDKLGLPKT